MNDTTRRRFLKAGVPFTTGYFMRTDPKILFLRERAATGAFGRVTHAAAWNCHGGSLVVMEAAYESARAGRWVAVAA